MLQVVKGISNVSAMNAMHNIRLSNEVNQLTSIIKQQNSMISHLASEMTEIKNSLGLQKK